MRTYTNMTWPDDPYRTGQQLYRRPVPRLAAFTARRTATGGRLAPAAVAIVYLPLHRTRTLTVTEQTLTFGFRAASTDDAAEMPGLAAIADLDLMQARRHAAILAGHLLAGDLAVLRQADDVAVWRGLAAVEREWANRGEAAGRAAMFDCQLDLPGSPSLEQACQQAGIISPHGSPPGEDRSADHHAAALAVERGLMIALLCARHQGRYDWAGTLCTGQVMAAATWDCLPRPAGVLAYEAAVADRADAALAVTRGSR
ncbi:MAG TPA: hypothetical protein VMV92_20955 [Streptosporangiaceae bacterium]|nr:hypothetical protein [Streptosporangiaceae bacterium]